MGKNILEIVKANKQVIKLLAVTFIGTIALFGISHVSYAMYRPVGISYKVDSRVTFESTVQRSWAEIDGMRSSEEPVCKHAKMDTVGPDETVFRVNPESVEMKSDTQDVCMGVKEDLAPSADSLFDRCYEQRDFYQYIGELKCLSTYGAGFCDDDMRQ